MTSPPSRKKQKNAFCFRFGACLCVVYSLEEESQTRTNERERERERERELRAKRTFTKAFEKKRKVLFPLSLSLVFARSHSNDLCSEKTIRSFFLPLPFFLRDRRLSCTSFSFLLSLFLVSSLEKLVEIYIHARARPTRSATNEYSEREERKTKKRRKKRALFDEDFDLERKGQKKKGSKKPASSLFLVFCLAHFFFFASAFAFFSSFSFMKSFSLATMKNVLLWKGLRRRGRTTKGHREEEEEGNDNDNNNNNKGCVGTRVIATREIRFLFFRRTVRRRSRYAPSFVLSLSAVKNELTRTSKSLQSL